MKLATKHMGLLVIILSMSFSMITCGSSKPCENCNDTPTKAYKNTSTDEKEYYSSDCSSDCAFCNDTATKHYTSGLGIIFVCTDCNDYIKELNSK